VNKDFQNYVGPVPTYYAAVRLKLRNPNPNLTFNLWELAHRLALSWMMENVHTIWIFLRHFVFELGASTGQTNGRTDGQTNG